VSSFAVLCACGGPGLGNNEHGGAAVLPPGEYLLFEPTASARELLGKQVIFDEQGAFRVADYLAPGCRVEVGESADEWNREFADHAGNLVSAGGSVLGLVELSAKHEQTTYSSMNIHNTQVLTARLKGPCGQQVITKVKVGNGSRKIYRARSTGGGIKLNLPQTGIGAALEGQDFEKLNMDMSWPTPQAWGFELGGQAQEDGVHLEANIDPTTMHNGESYRIRVRSDEATTLLIIAEEDLEHGGRSAVILPVLANGEVQHVSTKPGQWLELPQAVASLRDPALQQRDTLIVYALRNNAELDALELEYGELSDAARTEQAQRVMKRLDALPPQTVVRRKIGYLITPAQ